ncbi:MAG TPA: RNA methyltransferase [Thermoanaerobaculia bacterium]|jgi:TrmH family RNA methyltransferase|nr:RNA methyltransferase [Thermoanaerobaculia bacterium]
MGIESRRNRTLKDIRRLRRSKGDLALLEGPHLTAAALAAGLPLATVLATPEFLASAAGRALTGDLPSPPQVVEARLLEELADADSPRGLLAVASLPRAGVEALTPRAGGLYLYVEGLQDPGNLGALARVAEAAGADGMALSVGTVHPNHPRALRASAGSLLRLPVAVGVDAAMLDGRLVPASSPASAPPCWVVLVPRNGVDLYALPPAVLDGTLVLALGAEGPGISPALAARADLRLTIPLAPPVESLNATVAAALALFELRRRRHRG